MARLGTPCGSLPDALLYGVCTPYAHKYIRNSHCICRVPTYRRDTRHFHMARLLSSAAVSAQSRDDAHPGLPLAARCVPSLPRVSSFIARARVARRASASPSFRFPFPFRAVQHGVS